MFDVDVQGLRKIVRRQGVSRLVLELVGNSFDEPDCTHVAVQLEALGRGRAGLVVTDNAPEGFVNLRDAWTLFGDTRKRTDPGVRGRFNLGEKLVIAACEEASITTTSGSVRFAAGKRTRAREKRSAGSAFRGILRMTADELAQTLGLLRQVLVPETIRLVVNDESIPTRAALSVFSSPLWTEIADQEGRLRRVTRTALVGVYEAMTRPAALYELGIPVVEIPGPWCIDVRQKVPLNMDRDNVPPVYLRKLQAAVLNAVTAAGGAVPEPGAPWVRAALESPEATVETTTAVIHGIYGDRVVTRDPSDPEATNRCVAAGYRVIEPGSFSAAAWGNIRRAAVALPAGRVMPTRSGRVAPTEWLDEASLSAGMQSYRELVTRFCWELMNVQVEVSFVVAPQATTLASWRRSESDTPAGLTLNVGRLGVGWFESGLREEMIDLLLHEAAHEYESNHLSSGYHDACTKLGAKLALEVRDRPQLLDWK